MPKTKLNVLRREMKGPRCQVQLLGPKQHKWNLHSCFAGVHHRFFVFVAFMSKFAKSYVRSTDQTIKGQILIVCAPEMISGSAESKPSWTWQLHSVKALYMILAVDILIIQQGLKTIHERQCGWTCLSASYRLSLLCRKKMVNSIAQSKAFCRAFLDISHVLVFASVCVYKKLK